MNDYYSSDYLVLIYDLSFIWRKGKAFIFETVMISFLLAIENEIAVLD